MQVEERDYGDDVPIRLHGTSLDVLYKGVLTNYIANDTLEKLTEPAEITQKDAAGNGIQTTLYLPVPQKQSVWLQNSTHEVRLKTQDIAVLGLRANGNNEKVNAAIKSIQNIAKHSTNPQILYNWAVAVSEEFALEVIQNPNFDSVETLYPGGIFPKELVEIAKLHQIYGDPSQAPVFLPQYSTIVSGDLTRLKFALEPKSHVLVIFAKDLQKELAFLAVNAPIRERRTVFYSTEAIPLGENEKLLDNLYFHTLIEDEHFPGNKADGDKNYWPGNPVKNYYIARTSPTSSKFVDYLKAVGIGDEDLISFLPVVALLELQLSYEMPPVTANLFGPATIDLTELFPDVTKVEWTFNSKGLNREKTPEERIPKRTGDAELFLPNTVPFNAGIVVVSFPGTTIESVTVKLNLNAGCRRCGQKFNQTENYHGACHWHSKHPLEYAQRKGEALQELAGVDDNALIVGTLEKARSTTLRVDRFWRKLWADKTEFDRILQDHKERRFVQSSKSVLQVLANGQKGYVQQDYVNYQTPPATFATLKRLAKIDSRCEDLFVVYETDEKPFDRKPHGGPLNPNYQHGRQNGSYFCCDKSDDGCWVGHHSALTTQPDCSDMVARKQRGTEWRYDGRTSEAAYREIVAAEGDDDQVIALEYEFNAVHGGAITFLPGLSNETKETLLKRRPSQQEQTNAITEMTPLLRNYGSAIWQPDRASQLRYPNPRPPMVQDYKLYENFRRAAIERTEADQSRFWKAIFTKTIAPAQFEAPKLDETKFVLVTKNETLERFKKINNSWSTLEQSIENVRGLKLQGEILVKSVGAMKSDELEILKTQLARLDAVIGDLETIQKKRDTFAAQSENYYAQLYAAQNLQAAQAIITDMQNYLGNDFEAVLEVTALEQELTGLNQTIRQQLREYEQKGSFVAKFSKALPDMKSKFESFVIPRLTGIYRYWKQIFDPRFQIFDIPAIRKLQDDGYVEESQFSEQRFNAYLEKEFGYSDTFNGSVEQLENLRSFYENQDTEIRRLANFILSEDDVKQIEVLGEPPSPEMLKRFFIAKETFVGDEDEAGPMEDGIAALESYGILDELFEFFELKLPFSERLEKHYFAGSLETEIVPGVFASDANDVLLAIMRDTDLPVESFESLDADLKDFPFENMEVVANLLDPLLKYYFIDDLEKVVFFNMFPLLLHLISKNQLVLERIAEKKLAVDDYTVNQFILAARDTSIQTLLDQLKQVLYFMSPPEEFVQIDVDLFLLRLAGKSEEEAVAAKISVFRDLQKPKKLTKGFIDDLKVDIDIETPKDYKLEDNLVEKANNYAKLFARLVASIATTGALNGSALLQFDPTLQATKTRYEKGELLEKNVRLLIENRLNELVKWSDEDFRNFFLRILDLGYVSSGDFDIETMTPSEVQALQYKEFKPGIIAGLLAHPLTSYANVQFQDLASYNGLHRFAYEYERYFHRRKSAGKFSHSEIVGRGRDPTLPYDPLRWLGMTIILMFFSNTPPESMREIEGAGLNSTEIQDISTLIENLIEILIPRLSPENKALGVLLFATVDDPVKTMVEGYRNKDFLIVDEVLGTMWNTYEKQLRDFVVTKNPLIRTLFNAVPKALTALGMEERTLLKDKLPQNAFNYFLNIFVRMNPFAETLRDPVIFPETAAFYLTYEKKFPHTAWKKEDAWLHEDYALGKDEPARIAIPYEFETKWDIFNSKIQPKREENAVYILENTTGLQVALLASQKFFKETAKQYADEQVTLYRNDTASELAKRSAVTYAVTFPPWLGQLDQFDILRQLLPKLFEKLKLLSNAKAYETVTLSFLGPYQTLNLSKKEKPWYALQRLFEKSAELELNRQKSVDFAKTIKQIGKKLSVLNAVIQSYGELSPEDIELLKQWSVDWKALDNQFTNAFTKRDASSIVIPALPTQDQFVEFVKLSETKKSFDPETFYYNQDPAELLAIVVGCVQATYAGMHIELGDIIRDYLIIMNTLSRMAVPKFLAEDLKQKNPEYASIIERFADHEINPVLAENGSLQTLLQSFATVWSQPNDLRDAISQVEGTKMVYLPFTSTKLETAGFDIDDVEFLGKLQDLILDETGSKFEDIDLKKPLALPSFYNTTTEFPKLPISFVPLYRAGLTWEWKWLNSIFLKPSPRPSGDVTLMETAIPQPLSLLEDLYMFGGKQGIPLEIALGIRDGDGNRIAIPDLLPKLQKSRLFAQNVKNAYDALADKSILLKEFYPAQTDAQVFLADYITKVFRHNRDYLFKNAFANPKIFATEGYAVYGTKTRWVAVPSDEKRANEFSFSATENLQRLLVHISPRIYFVLKNETLVAHMTPYWIPFGEAPSKFAYVYSAEEALELQKLGFSLPADVQETSEPNLDFIPEYARETLKNDILSSDPPTYSQEIVGAKFASSATIEIQTLVENWLKPGKTLSMSIEQLGMIFHARYAAFIK